MFRRMAAFLNAKPEAEVPPYPPMNHSQYTVRANTNKPGHPRFANNTAPLSAHFLSNLFRRQPKHFAQGPHTHSLGSTAPMEVCDY